MQQRKASSMKLTVAQSSIWTPGSQNPAGDLCQEGARD